MLHTICGSGMTLRLIRPICPFNCFLFRVDSLYHLHLNGGILQIIRSLTDHINGFDFISTLAVALSFFFFFFLDYQAVTERHVCLALIAKRTKKRKVFEASRRNLKTLTRWACEASEQHFFFFFFSTENKMGEQWSRYQAGGDILLVYTCTQSWKFN